MSRLQVGGLALVVKGDKYVGDIDVGKVVVLLEHFNIGIDSWFVQRIDGTKFYCMAHRLMPLGDKQTQEELMKELEVESC